MGIIFDVDFAYLFSSRRCILAVKYCVRTCVLLTHCNDAFIKQVFPKLFKPVAPFSVGKAINFTVISSTSINQISKWMNINF